MKRRILAYLDYIDDILQNDDSNDKEHWDKLINLIVFALVAVCTVISIMTVIATGKLEIIPLIILLFVLLIPYCAHYYLLENSVQKMYEQYDEMIGKTESYFKVKKKK